MAPTQISLWKLHLRQQAQVFVEAPTPAATAPDMEPLYAAIGWLQMENALLKKRWGHVSSPATCAGGPVSVHARCQALGLARSSFYYQPCGESAYNLELMRLLDEEFTRHNFKGVLGLRYLVEGVRLATLLPPQEH